MLQAEASHLALQTRLPQAKWLLPTAQLGRACAETAHATPQPNMAVADRVQKHGDRHCSLGPGAAQLRPPCENPLAPREPRSPARTPLPRHGIPIKQPRPPRLGERVPQSELASLRSLIKG